MFCDLADLTGIAAKLDAHRIPRANCCATAPSVVHEGHIHAYARSLAISAPQSSRPPPGWSPAWVAISEGRRDVRAVDAVGFDGALLVSSIDARPQ